LLIGASGDDTNGNDVGQAHLFDANTGTLLRTFEDPSATSLDQFGISVAMDGTRVLIGAMGDNNNGFFVGQAYLYDAVSGELLQTFDDPTPTGEDQFGTSVALDGNYVLVGARGDDTNGSNIGQAHLFDAITGSLLWTFNDPTITSTDEFGYSVALNGGRVLVGAYRDDTQGFEVGQAYLYSIVQGDLDGDGFVGISDLNIILGNWNEHADAGVWLQGDLSGDGFIGIEDLNTVLGNWNIDTPPTGNTNIPEPSVTTLLLIGSLALLRRNNLHA
jgi:hypothetical protein